MSFFFNLQKKKSTTNKERKQAVSLDLCYSHGCKVCPSNADKFIKTPKMEPTGSDKPTIYVLGEAPGDHEDFKGKQFIGDSGRILRNALKDTFGDDYISENIRINNCVRCRPYTVTKKRRRDGGTKETVSNRTPTVQEIACCKKSIEQDIENTKPEIIIGTGNIPLHWIIGQTGINNWRGRRIPVKIGEHTAWYFPILHPAFVLRKRGKKGYATEYDEVFKLDVQNVKNFLAKKRRPKPIVIEDGYEKNIHYVTGLHDKDFETVKKWLEHLKTLPIVALDIEGTGLKPWDDNKLLSIAIGTDKEVYAFPVEHYADWDIKPLLKDFLLNSGVKVAHNLKFELTWFLHYFGAEVIYETEWADTMSQAYVLDERSGKGILSLDGLCLQHFGFNLKKQNKVDVRNLLSASLHDVLLYNGMDTKYTYKLFISQSSRMPKSLKPVEKHHNDVCKTLALTETKGVLVNPKATARISKKLQKEIDQLEEELAALPEVKKYKRRFKEDFQYTSSPKLVKMLKDVLMIPIIKETKNKNYSTDKIVLEKLAAKGVTLAVYIEKLRGLNKLKSTYVDSIPKLTSDDGMLRASFNSCRTDTGRFSSTEPNMQNFPKRNNSYVRRQIVAPRGYKLVAADYKQLEASVICMASGETNIIEHDVHADWSRRILKACPKAGGVKHLDDMSDGQFKKFRSKVKNGLVFPWFYGAGKNSVGASLDLPKHVTNKLHKDFWKYFSRVKDWQDGMLKFYAKNGYVEGLTGRRRRPPLSRNQLLNSTIQGGASDVVVASMNRLSKMSYDLEIPHYQAVLNIHDDLSFIIPDEEVDGAIKVIAKEMVKDFPFMNGIPLEVEVSLVCFRRIRYVFFS
jgi:uracil-DNA glycosylase family 4